MEYKFHSFSFSNECGAEKSFYNSDGFSVIFQNYSVASKSLLFDSKQKKMGKNCASFI